MKKIIIGLLGLCLIVAGVYVYWQQQSSGVAVEDILPQNTLVYVHVNDVEKNLMKVAATPIWQAVSHIDFDALARSGVMSPQQKAVLDFVRAQVMGVGNSPVAKQLFGREVAVAIYSVDRDVASTVQNIQALDPKVVETLLSGIYLVTRVGPDTQLAEFVSRVLGPAGPKVSSSQTEYKGMVIHNILLTDVGVSLGVVRIKDFLVIGLGDTAARVSTDVFKKDISSLKQSPQFAKTQSTAKDFSGIQASFDLEGVMDLMKTLVNNLSRTLPDPSKAQGHWDEVFAQMKGVKMLGLNLAMASPVIMDTRLLFDPAQLNSEYAALYTCPSDENQTTRFVPKDVLMYHWNNCLNLDHYWGQVKKGLAQLNADPDTAIRNMEMNIGLSIEQDILPAFGDEMGGFISDIEVNGLFPIPKLLVFAQIQDQAKARVLLEKASVQIAAMIQEENYQGVEIKYLGLPLGPALQPGYCFLGDYLLVATSRQMLKDSIDIAADPSLALSANTGFREVVLARGLKSRTQQFIKIGLTVEKIDSILEWLNQWMQGQGQQTEAFKAGIEKPLEEVRADIARKEGEWKDLQGKISLLDDDIWNEESKGGDPTALKSQLAELKKDADLKQSEIEDARDRQANMEDVLQGGKDQRPDAELRQAYLEEIISPVLDSLKSVEFFGLNVTSDERSLHSSFIFKFQD